MLSWHPAARRRRTPVTKGPILSPRMWRYGRIATSLPPGMRMDMLTPSPTGRACNVSPRRACARGLPRGAPSTCRDERRADRRRQGAPAAPAHERETRHCCRGQRPERPLPRRVARERRARSSARRAAHVGGAHAPSPGDVAITPFREGNGLITEEVAGVWG